MYKFTADRQFIFNVSVAGRIRMVAFGERNGDGVSTFVTEDRSIAECIRRTRPFRMGAITETIEGNGVAEDTGDAATIEADVTDAPNEGLTEMTFNNISQAKAYIEKTFGIPKPQMKKPELVEQMARENGIVIKYVEE